MKKSIFVLGLIVLVVQFGFTQIKVTSTGSVGIGTSTPSASSNITVQGTNILFRSSASGFYNINFSFNESSRSCDISPAGAYPSSATSLGGSRIWDSGNFYNLSTYSLGTNSLNGNYLSVYTYDGCHVTAYDISCQNFYNYSDKRLKNNINSLPFDRSSFSKLNPVSFDMSDSLLIAKKDKKDWRKSTTTHQYGFIAQDIQELYPQLVVKDDSTGFLKIKPLELIPILVKALQDQQAQIDQLKSEIKNSSPSKVKSSGDIPVGETQAAALFQNSPNPFSQSTQIKYYLPSTVQTALLCIYDLQGKQLKQITISERGNGSQLIYAAEFAAGIYLYGLIADGNEVDVKRMILTK
jgi:hypothetical protein